MDTFDSERYLCIFRSFNIEEKNCWVYEFTKLERNSVFHIAILWKSVTWNITVRHSNLMNNITDFYLFQKSFLKIRKFDLLSFQINISMWFLTVTSHILSLHFVWLIHIRYLRWVSTILLISFKITFLIL